MRNQGENEKEETKIKRKKNRRKRQEGEIGNSTISQSEFAILCLQIVILFVLLFLFELFTEIPFSRKAEKRSLKCPIRMALV